MVRYDFSKTLDMDLFIPEADDVHDPISLPYPVTGEIGLRIYNKGKFDLTRCDAKVKTDSGFFGIIIERRSTMIATSTTGLLPGRPTTFTIEHGATVVIYAIIRSGTKDVKVNFECFQGEANPRKLSIPL